MWTTLIRKGNDSGFNLRRARKITEVYDDISLYTPKYLPAGSMGYDSRTLLYTLTKPIKVRNSDGSFTIYDVPEFAVEGVYISLGKPKVLPIANLVTLNQLSSIPVLQLSVLPTVAAKVLKALPTLVSTTTKPNPIVKLPVPLSLLPYIANVSSDGVAFFKVPDGYNSALFEDAVQIVYSKNDELAQKPMVYYEQPQLLVLKLEQQLLAVLLSLKLYLAHRQQIALLSLAQKLQATLGLNMKKVPVEGVDEPDLVTEVFAYPSRWINMYNIHPEAYLKVLEYLNDNFKKTETYNKPYSHVLSPSGFNNVPIGGEVNDSVFNYISKDGKQKSTYRLFPECKYNK